LKATSVEEPDDPRSAAADQRGIDIVKAGRVSTVARDEKKHHAQQHAITGGSGAGRALEERNTKGRASKVTTI